MIAGVEKTTAALEHSSCAYVTTGKAPSIDSIFGASATLLVMNKQ
jgi:hypothetical protein